MERIQVSVSLIDVGIPKFQWLMGRITDDEFREVDPEVYRVLRNEGFTRSSLLEHFDEIYSPYLYLPLLLEKYVVEGATRYRVKDGHRRLSVLVGRRGAEVVTACPYREGMTKDDWEYGYLLELQRGKT